MSGMRTIDVSQRRCDPKGKKRSVCIKLDLRSQPRNWAEFIHEFIYRQWVGSSRSEESGDGVVGSAKALSSISQ